MTRRPLSSPTIDNPTTSNSRPAGRGGGWDPHRQNRRAAFGKEFQVPEGEQQLVRFLDDEPFESYYRHWLRDRPKGERQTFTCIGEECPLCEAGDKPAFLVLFNIIDMLAEGGPAAKVWSASPNPAGLIEEFALNEKYAPLNRLDGYFAVSKKKGTNGIFGYSMMPVKARDLPEDWDGLKPLTEPEIEKLAADRKGSDYIRTENRSELVRIAEDLED